MSKNALSHVSFKNSRACDGKLQGPSLNTATDEDLSRRLIKTDKETGFKFLIDSAPDICIRPHQQSKSNRSLNG